MCVTWKAVIAAASFLVTTHVCLAAEAPTDGGKLLAYCEEAEKTGSNVNPFRGGYCMAFIEGTLRGWEASSFVRDAPVNYCIPADVTMGQLIGVVTKHLRDNPSRLSGKAELSVISAMQKAYPCAAGRQQR
jgi:hypothetical protein